MNLLHTLRTNSRDILVGVAVIVAVALISDIVSRIAITTSGFTWLTNVTASLSGLSKFLSANLYAWIGLAVAWPTLNRFSNHSFTETWQKLSDETRFWVFIVVAVGLGIMAAICAQ